MGQYYVIANFDKKQYIEYDEGVKLTEFSWIGNYCVNTLLKLLATSWKGDRVYVIGDYAQSGTDEPHKDSSLSYMDTLIELENEFRKNLEQNHEEFDTLYHGVCEHFEKLPLETIAESEYRYVYNHEKKIFVDFAHCPISNTYYLYNRDSFANSVISPLPLLLAMGNGQSGGDYYGDNKEAVGSWCATSQSIEVTQNALDNEYQEYSPNFTESILIDEAHKKDFFQLARKYAKEHSNKKKYSYDDVEKTEPYIFIDPRIIIEKQ